MVWLDVRDPGYTHGETMLEQQLRQGISDFGMMLNRVLPPGELSHQAQVRLQECGWWALLALRNALEEANKSPAITIAQP
jgi:hypothetical protein